MAIPVGVDYLVNGEEVVADVLNRPLTNIEANLDIIFINGIPPWNIGITYQTNAFVKHNGIIYRAKQTTLGNTPSGSPSNWERWEGNRQATETDRGTVTLTNSLTNTSQTTAISAYAVSQLKLTTDGLQSNKADKVTTITAGNGLTGGGSLASNRTITLGTPSTISGTTSNSVSGSTHVHAISSTSSRSINSTSTMLTAKAMFDHTSSGDHDSYNDGRYMRLNTQNFAQGSFYTTANRIQMARGNGGVALTKNDGYGNANVTFNHMDGTPDQNGNAARISMNTDATSNGQLSFQVRSGGTAGNSFDLTEVMTMHQNVVDCRVALRRNGVDVVDVNRAVNTGGGLTGGGNLNSNRTISIASGGVTTTHLANGSVNNSKLANDAVTRSKIKDYEIFNNHLQGNSVDTRVLAGGSVSTGALQNNAVTSAKLANGSGENSWVRDRIATSGVGVVGSYALLRVVSGDNVQPGNTRSGSNLEYSSSYGGNGQHPPGNWRAMGYTHGSSPDTKVTLFLRYS